MENMYNSDSVIPNKPVDTYDPYGENISPGTSPVSTDNSADNSDNSDNSENNPVGDFQNNSENSSENNSDQNSNSNKKSSRNKKKKSKKPIVITIIVVVVLLLIILIARGCSKMMTKVTESLGEDVIVEEYGMKDMTTYINTSGKVGSQTVCKVTTSLQYPIKEIKVEIGDRVKKGDVLCTIDTTELDEKIEALEAQASDEDRRAATEIEISNRQLNQARESSDTNVANAAQAVTDAENAVAQAEGERIEAEQALNQAEQALNQKKKQAEKEAEKARKQAEKEAEKAKKEAKKNKKKGKNTDTDATTETTTQATTQNSTELSEKDPDVVAYNTAKQVYTAAVQKKEEKVAAHKAAVDAYNQALQGQKDTIQNAENSNELTLSGISSYSQTASQLAECYKMKNDSVILAETDGIVTAMNGIEGLVANGPIMQIEDDKNLQIAVDIKERDILTINESMKAEISNNALEEVTGKGQVSKVINFVSGSGSEAQISQTGESADKYSAIIKVTEANNMLLGMNVKVKISTGTQVQVMAVPYTAIMNDDDGEYVCVAIPAGTSGMYMVQRVGVETGVTGDYYTEIVGGELKEGAKVISYPDTVTIGGVIKVAE